MSQHQQGAVRDAGVDDGDGSKSPWLPLSRKRVYVACTNCRKVKIRCEYQTDMPGDPGDPCERCKRMNLSCQFLTIQEERPSWAAPKRRLSSFPDTVTTNQNFHQHATIGSSRRARAARFAPTHSVTVDTGPGSLTPSLESEAYGHPAYTQEWYPSFDEVRAPNVLSLLASLSDEGHSATSRKEFTLEAPESSTSQPSDAELCDESSIPSISTFVILLPKIQSSTGNDHTAICPDDASYLQNHVQSGGNACSIHRSIHAEDWIEKHFDSGLLDSIRDAGLGGPIATMVSPEMPGLAVFGTVLDQETLQLAQTLADSSNFPVMVRPVEDDPVVKFDEAARMAFDSDGLEDEMDVDKQSDDVDFSESGDDSEEDEGSYRLDAGAFRLRGGATPGQRTLHGTDDADYIVSTGVDRPDGFHRTRVRLHLRVRSKGLYDMAIFSKTAFKFQTEKSEDPRSLSEPMSRPQLLSCVDLKVETRPSEVLIDRSYSNIGFVVHCSNFIADRECLPRGFDPPSQTITHGTQKSIEHGKSISGGLDNMSPTFSLKASSSRSMGETIQRADNKPAPSCRVKEQVGKEWNSLDKSYSSYGPTETTALLPQR
ncbi:hypothetical protein FB45DRAFT_919186 [Roridomyces roridus]|uniref:Zn(2)-C6 fungal-type domain-containing protein n=1 Tax=Roridomyces roridus TaxID=1738132 RepID=A0AAD7FNA7_9AGAR|nr:hypothetical protein FB45DRAFT_919186 [Roridomyces roridus]